MVSYFHFFLYLESIAAELPNIDKYCQQVYWNIERIDVNMKLKGKAEDRHDVLTALLEWKNDQDHEKCGHEVAADVVIVTRHLIFLF